MESAKKFKRLVTSRVLSLIRKTGAYSFAGTQTERISVVDVARLSAIIDREMVRLYSKPHDIARAFEMFCEQFGIVLRGNFVNVPEYEQTSFLNI